MPLETTISKYCMEQLPSLLVHIRAWRSYGSALSASQLIPI